MNSRHVQIVDSQRMVLAEADVKAVDDHFAGVVDLRATPEPIRCLFDEFEEVVTEQMFVFLDQIQDQIEALALKVRFEDGQELSVHDLQVFPGSNELSFRLATLAPRPESIKVAATVTPMVTGKTS